MAENKLQTRAVTMPRSRNVGDMQKRNDLLLNQDVFTSIVRRVNKQSPFLIFTRLFGESFGSDDTGGLFDLQTSSIGAEFIRIREECEVRIPFKIVDDSLVPETIVANVNFEVTLDSSLADIDENLLAEDQKTMFAVVSRGSGVFSNNSGGNATRYTLRMNGLPGETVSGSILSRDKALNPGFGNSKGEGSLSSNHIEDNVLKYNTFANPMTITRYATNKTGSYLADEVFKLEMAMDGSQPFEFATDLSVKFFTEVLSRLDSQVVFSRANFDPATLEILGRGNTSRYQERPTYAGILQQMDQATIQYKHQFRAPYLQSLNKLESIAQEINTAFPGSDILMVVSGPGKKWAEDVIREGGLAKYPVRINVSPVEDKITVGFGIKKFVTGSGVNIYLYDLGAGMRIPGEYKTISYGGVKGGPRGGEIFFIPIKNGPNGAKKKVAKYFTKSGQIPGHNRVNRGFVFGVSRGITGEGNGHSGDQLMSMQDDAIHQMMNNSRYDVNSTVDGNEYHCLFHGTPYIDIDGIIKMTLS